MQRGNEFTCGVHPLLLVINTIKELIQKLHMGCNLGQQASYNTVVLLVRLSWQ